MTNDLYNDLYARLWRQHARQEFVYVTTREAWELASYYGCYHGGSAFSLVEAIREGKQLFGGKPIRIKDKPDPRPVMSRKLFYDPCGPYLAYCDGTLHVADLNPEWSARWKVSRGELFRIGLRCIRAALDRQ
jgi:hypothetical protein